MSILPAAFAASSQDSAKSGEFHSIRAECLDWLLILNRRHLERVLRVFVEHYNMQRPHRALELQPPEPGKPLSTSTVGEVRRHDRFGGLIREYYRDAA